MFQNLDSNESTECNLAYIFQAVRAKFERVSKINPEIRVLNAHVLVRVRIKEDCVDLSILVLSISLNTLKIQCVENKIKMKVIFAPKK